MPKWHSFIGFNSVIDQHKNDRYEIIFRKYLTSVAASWTVKPYQIEMQNGFQTMFGWWAARLSADGINCECSLDMAIEFKRNFSYNSLQLVASFGNVKRDYSRGLKMFTLLF